MGSLTAALRHEISPAMAWPRQFPRATKSGPAFVEPLGANGGAGPYWRSARAMALGGIGAVLFDPASLELPVIPPFEGRGFALEYLLKSALADASLADETMLDLVDPAATREAQGLDMLMLLAS